ALVLGEGALAHAAAPLGHAAEGRQLAQQDLEEGRLAGAVGAGDAEDLAARHLQVQVLEEDALAVAAGEILDLEDLRARALARGEVEVHDPRALLGPVEAVET